LIHTQGHTPDPSIFLTIHHINDEATAAATKMYCSIALLPQININIIKQVHNIND